MKNKLLKNTIILLIASMFIRLLSLVNRIILTRSLGEDGISLYSLILPTIMLFMSISCFSLNTAMIKVSAIHKNKKVIKHGIIISIITSSISSLILLFILPYLSNTLLKQPLSYYPILFSIPLFYLTAISSVLRGFLTGIEKISTTSFANLIEQISRIIFTLVIFIFIGNQTIQKYVLIAVFAMSIGEFFSILFTSINIKKIKLENINNDDKYITKQLLDISLPATLTSLISNFTFFLEPIIYTFILSKLSFSSGEIILKYSEVTAYALPLISLFSFITIAISTVIMPKISTSSTNTIKEYISKLIIICLIPGCLISIILFFYCDDILYLMYKTTTGNILIKKYIWFFIIFYIIPPFNSILQATNNSKKAFIISLITHILKILLLIILPFITNDALIICYLISYILTFLFQFIFLKKQYHFTIPFNNLIKLLIISLICCCIAIILNLMNINFIFQIIIIGIIYLFCIWCCINRCNK